MTEMISFTEEYYVQAIHNLDVYNIFSVNAFARNNIQDRIGKSLKVVYRHIETFDDSDDFFAIFSNMQMLVDVINHDLFKKKDVDILDELVQLKTNCKSESLVKMLTLIGMIQEFFGANRAATHFTRSDLSGVLEEASAIDSSFMSIHMIHYFFHKGYEKRGLFSMYGNADLNDDAMIEESLEFASHVFSKLQQLLSYSMFDKLLVEFYEQIGSVKEISNEEVSYFLTNSVSGGTSAVNPIAARLEELGFAEVST